MTHIIEFSTPANLETPEALQKDIKLHHGHLWECIGRRPGPHGGYVYDYEVQKKYKSIFDLSRFDSNYEPIAIKTAEIFPAVEPDKEGLLNMINLITKNQKLFDRLGYQISETPYRLSLPDAQALKSGFEELKKEYDLKSLDVRSFHGKASEEDYIEAFCQGADAILSTTHEFVHDHYAHLLKMIHMCVKFGEFYYEWKVKLAQLVKEEVLVRITRLKNLIENEPDKKRKQELTQVLNDAQTSATLYIDTVWIFGSSYEHLLNFESNVFNHFPYDFNTLWTTSNYQDWINKQRTLDNPSHEDYFNEQWRQFRELTEPNIQSGSSL